MKEYGDKDFDPTDTKKLVQQLEKTDPRDFQHKLSELSVEEQRLLELTEAMNEKKPDNKK